MDKMYQADTRYCIQIHFWVSVSYLDTFLRKVLYLYLIGNFQKVSSCQLILLSKSCKLHSTDLNVFKKLLWLKMKTNHAQIYTKTFCFIFLISQFRTMYDFPHSQANSSSIMHAQNRISEQYLGKNMYLKCVGLSKPCISICICILSRYIGQKSICIVSRYLIWQSMCILSRYRKKVSLPTTAKN